MRGAGTQLTVAAIKYALKIRPATEKFFVKEAAHDRAEIAGGEEAGATPRNGTDTVVDDEGSEQSDA